MSALPKNHIALFIVGEPGVGKTTAIRHLVPELRSGRRTGGLEVTKPKWTMCGRTVLAGHYHGDTFDGGDTVPYTGARLCLDYWKDHLLAVSDLTIFDGDRFSTQPSLDFVRQMGVTILGVHLVLSPEVVATRRAARGSNQNETWLKGRQTKAKNFAEKIGAMQINAVIPPQNVAMLIRSAIGSQ